MILLFKHVTHEYNLSNNQRTSIEINYRLRMELVRNNLLISLICPGLIVTLLRLDKRFPRSLKDC